ncbi:MAG: discoidin domain-containing protein [Thermoleophilia bacterium]
MDLPSPRTFARGHVLAVTLLLALTLAGHARAATPPTGFEEEAVVSGLSSPVAAAPAPDGRIFVAEKPGYVRVVDANGTLAQQPLLDLTSEVNSYHDRGLLGIAVDRDFALNGYLYLLFTHEVSPLAPDSSAPMVARLLRVTVSPGNMVSGQTVLLGTYGGGPCPPPSNTVDCIPSDGSSHSIGTIRVDPADGTLWIGVGDSASFTQVDELAFRTYDERSLAGKILHVDRNGRGLAGHPFCPANADLTQVCTKLYAKGFRNPFRFSLRPDGAPVVGDVQWDAREELNIARSGANHGWPCWEAENRTPGYRDDPRCQELYAAGGDTKPLYSYPHFDGSGSNSSAVVGGPEYNATDWPAEYRSSIYFGDYAKGFVKRIRVDDADNCRDTDSAGRCTAIDFATGWYGAVDLQAAPGGGLLFVEFGDGGPNGSIKRFVYTAGNKAPTAVADADPRFGAAPLEVQFSGARSSDPEGTALTYLWDFGDGSASTTVRDPRHVYAANGSYTASLTVSDGERSDTDTVVISPGNTPPRATLSAPLDESLYRAGQTIDLSGSAVDDEDGQLGGAAIEWRITLVHGDHDHPLSRFTGTTASFVTTDDHDADSYYRVTLVATDAGGLTDERTIEIRPQTTTFELKSLPEDGAAVSYGGIAGNTTLTRTSAIGYRTTISAALTYDRLGTQYLFDHWSNGGARTQTITIPDSPSAVTAVYREDKAALRPATASSTQRAGLEPEKANDVDSTTRWSSSYSDDQWWQVDLGATRQVDAVEINWEAAYASRYKILTSTDGASFTEAADVSITSRRTERSSFAARAARYVRVLGVTRATGWGISFLDVRVLGPDDEAPPPPADLALNKPASSSSTYNATLTAAKANDGDSSTRWSSAKGLDNEWWQVDLGTVTTIDAVELNWETAYARTYEILTSVDGTTFTRAAEVSLSAPGLERTTFPARDARHVRVLGLTRATPYGFSFWDARVFAPSA